MENGIVKNIAKSTEYLRTPPSEGANPLVMMTCTKDGVWSGPFYESLKNQIIKEIKMAIK